MLRTARIGTSLSTLRLFAVASCLGASLAIACGGATEPKTPTAGTDDGGTTGPEDAGPSTTTTVTLGEGGNLTGTKLETTTSATASFDGGAHDAAAPPPGGHDPGRSPQDIQTIIQTRRDEARACYDAALKDHPGLEGNIDIKWTIDPKGVVTETAIDDAKSDIHEANLGKCIGAIIKKIAFAASPRGVETKVHYPFNFHPRNGPVRPPG
ncbi:hypothetical protein BH09MYX1_BH09MYX1_05090 [soil metagenome]